MITESELKEIRDEIFRDLENYGRIGIYSGCSISSGEMKIVHKLGLSYKGRYIVSIDLKELKNALKKIK